MDSHTIRRLVAPAFLCLLLLAAAPASAADRLLDPINQWLPSSDDATWTYAWTDSTYAPAKTREQYSLSGRDGSSFRLAWTTDGQGNEDGSISSSGSADYRRTDLGLINTNWNGTQPPPQFPILCASATQCGNSVAGVHFMLIWGTRSPVLPEPLLTGTSWSALGGASNDVSSTNRYLGRDRVRVAAFPEGVEAAKIESDVTQAGAIGDPYGSGQRTVWWVYGVGPVKIGFRHADGSVQDAELLTTNLKPLPAPPDTNYLPLNTGGRAVFSWRNSKHLKTPSKQQFSVAQVVNNTARVDVKSISGPIKIAGSYVFATRAGGVTNLATTTRSASKAKFPRLGPRSLPTARRRHLLTPFDLMTYGYNPVLPGYPVVGQSWTSSKSSRDYTAFGVTGTSKVVGVKTIRVRAGRFRALMVQSKLRQPGFPFGTGTRTSWFAPGKGLVKLVFRHGDGSVSTVERLR